MLPEGRALLGQHQHLQAMKEGGGRGQTEGTEVGDRCAGEHGCEVFARSLAGRLADVGLASRLQHVID